MTSKTSNALFFIMTTMFVFVNTSHAKFLLIELDGEYENEDVRTTTEMKTTAAETNNDEFSKPESSDEAPVSIENSENVEDNIDDDDSLKARLPGNNTMRDSSGQRSLRNKTGKVIIISFFELL